MTSITSITPTPPAATVETPAIDIAIPAFDTLAQSLTPIVAAALKTGATVRPHPTDVTKIIVAIADRKDADTFEAAIKTALKAA